MQSADARLPMQDDSAWVPMSVYDGAIWQAGDLPPNPIDIRITNDMGQKGIARYAVNCAGRGNQVSLGSLRSSGELSCWLLCRQIYNGGAGGDVLTDVQFPVPAPYPAPDPGVPPSAPPLQPPTGPTGLLSAPPQLPTLTGAQQGELLFL